MNEISNYDISEIGSVDFNLNFDDYDYEEFLKDNSLRDNKNTRMEYIKNGYCDYDVEFYDSVTYHHLGYDRMTYDEIEEYFGTDMANDVLNASLNSGTCSFEPYLYSTNKNINLNDPKELSDAALKFLRHGKYFKNARGFILPDGNFVFTDMEHNECTKIPGVKGTFDFIKLGCIRVLPQSIDISKRPTKEQFETLYDIMNHYYGKEFYMDLYGEKRDIFNKKYDYCDNDEIINDINSYFNGKKMRVDNLYEKRNLNTRRKYRLKHSLVESKKERKIYPIKHNRYFNN